MNSPCAPSSWRVRRSFLGKQLLGAQAILPACFGPSVLWLKRIEAVKGAANDKGNYLDFGSVWAKDRASIANRATVTLGLRFDTRSIFGSAVSPKAGLNLRVTDFWRIRASYGRGFRVADLGQLFYRSLNPTNFYQVTGNPNLRPEYAHSVQIGGEFTSRNRRTRCCAQVESSSSSVYYNGIRIDL
jgi:outer membrane receptor protein involved in Fe transport